MQAELGSTDWFFICGGARRGELAFTVFLPFLNCSGALRPFATWGLFHQAQESSTRWIWSIWQEWSLIRMDVQTALWAQIRTPWLIWVSLVGVSVFGFLFHMCWSMAWTSIYFDPHYIPAAWIWVTNKYQREVFLSVLLTVIFPVLKVFCAFYAISMMFGRMNWNKGLGTFKINENHPESLLKMITLAPHSPFQCGIVEFCDLDVGRPHSEKHWCKIL